MRKIFKEDLVYRGERVDWKNCVGLDIRFIYDDIEGSIQIIDYLGVHLVLDYDGKISKSKSSVFLSGNLCTILGIRHKGFKFEIGHNFKTETRDCILIDQMYSKGDKCYNTKCNKCGGESLCLESDLYRRNCPVCNNRKVIKGINSFGDIKPDLIKYLKNEEDAYKYSASSDVMIEVICPDCKTEHNKRLRLYDLNKRNGFTCEICGDKDSIPNKIGKYIFAKFLGDDFISEYNPQWKNLRKRRYDFYFELDGIKYVVELDGGFHKPNKYDPDGKAVKNDLEKTRIANENGCEMIRIDCSNSKIWAVYDSIKNSKLNLLFNFEIIDESDMLRVISSNRIKDICEYKKNNSNTSIKEISNIFKVSRSTVSDSLRIGNKAFDWFSL